MARIKPFRGIRPAADKALQVAALPYDVYSREEARKAVEGKPFSFLNIDRPETRFPASADMYAPEVYAEANRLFRSWLKEGIFIRDEAPSYYIYELTMDGRVQTGIAALSHIDDYLSGVCKKHENTVEEKEQDRIRHVDALSAQTGPIFLMYRGEERLKALVEEAKRSEALCDITSEDGIRHRLFRIAEPGRVSAMEEAFRQIPATYIADGHHRAASAVKVGLKRREEHPGYTGEEEFNYFLSVLFPAEELRIMDYNRVVKDLNGLRPEEFLMAVEESFELMRLPMEHKPEEKGELSLFLDGNWYLLRARPSILREREGDPVRALDVSLLQEVILEPVLGIKDPRTDKRISFVGGIRGLRELEKQVSRATYSHAMDGTLEKVGPAAAFALYPTGIEELLRVADQGRLMPPKSTWFEPKLRSGFLIHEIER